MTLQEVEKYYTSMFEEQSNILENKYLETGKYVEKVHKHLFPHLSKDDIYGADFGSGLSVPTVLGKIEGKHIIGIDVLENNRKTDYTYIHEKLIKDGHEIHKFDTKIIPWKYENNTFDFVHSSWSIWCDFKNDVESENVEAGMIQNRICEFIRITRQNGKIIIRVPNKYVEKIKVYYQSIEYKKGICLILIEDNTTLGPRSKTYRVN
jgi:hypothetical protein